MVECKKLKDCPFFNDRMANMPGTSKLYKLRYCNSEYKKCARYIMADILGSNDVPIDLFPNQHERVNKLLFEINHSK